MARDLPAMREAGLARYHEWAFAVVRQAGSAFELAAAHLRWLAQYRSDSGFEAPAQCFTTISSLNKSLILKGARAVATGKAFDPLEPAATMARAWDEGMSLLGEALSRQNT
jgi:hypothetical protein